MISRDDVYRFHRKFGFAAPDRPTVPGPDLAAQRHRLLQSEVLELPRASEQGDLAGCLGEIIDVIYIALGTAVAFGLSVDAAWDAIHAANMRKYPNPEPGGKPLKPPGWTKPNLARLIEEQQ